MNFKQFHDQFLTNIFDNLMNLITNTWLESGGGHILVMLTGIAGLAAAALTAVRRLVAWLAKKLTPAAEPAQFYRVEMLAIPWSEQGGVNIVGIVEADSLAGLMERIDKTPWPVLGIEPVTSRFDYPQEYVPEVK